MSQKYSTMFSKACEYGIRAAIYVARESKRGNRSSLNEIASAIDSPVAFTAKILQLLARNKIISSIKGPSGGYEIGKSQQNTISLQHIVAAIDGDRIYNGCGLGLQECNALKPCPVHNDFVEIRNNLKNMLVATKVSDLAEGVVNGTTFLKR